MTWEISTAEYRALAQLRYLIRHFVSEGDTVSRAVEANGYVRRTRGREDRRRVLVFLLPRGERMLEQVARHRIGELRATGHELVRTIDQLLEKTAAPRSSVAKKPARKGAHQKRG